MISQFQPLHPSIEGHLSISILFRHVKSIISLFRSHLTCMMGRKEMGKGKDRGGILIQGLRGVLRNLWIGMPIHIFHNKISSRLRRFTLGKILFSPMPIDMNLVRESAETMRIGEWTEKTWLPIPTTRSQIITTSRWVRRRPRGGSQSRSGWRAMSTTWIKGR